MPKNKGGGGGVGLLNKFIQPVTSVKINSLKMTVFANPESRKLKIP